MRRCGKDLERLQVGSKLNTLAATDNRVEMERNLRSAVETASSGQRDLAALIAERDGYMQIVARGRLGEAVGRHRQAVAMRASR